MDKRVDHADGKILGLNEALWVVEATGFIKEKCNVGAEELNQQHFLPSLGSEEFNRQIDTGWELQAGQYISVWLISGSKSGIARK
uniref:Uncharacterized protein n=1 Tax=Romanomermis culicivorax TaxID=13658 RepID=A0A915JEU1_ROMCU